MTNVVLISFDALRFDHVNDRTDVAPFLHERAADGIRLDGHFSTGSGTSTSFPGIHASALPLDHGYAGLNEHHTSLAEVLQDSGVETLGVTAQTSCSSLFDYHRGFDVFEDWVERDGLDDDSGDASALDTLERGFKRTVERIPGLSELAFEAAQRYRERNPPDCPYRQAPEITDTSIDLVTDHIDPGDDFFVWIHYMEPHQPYHPPRDCIEAFHDGEFDIGRMYRTIQTVKRARPDVVQGTMGNAISEDEKEAIRDYYAAATHFVDREAERLVGKLHSRGYLDETTLFFTADHGEELFDHGDFGHPPKLYDELVHVPLIVDDRSGALNRSEDVSALTSHLDLAPTITDLLDVDPVAEWRGDSMTDLLAGATDRHREHVIAELCHTSGLGGSIQPEQLVAAVRTDEYKYVRNRQLGSESLNDLQADPSERQEVHSDRAEAADSLRTILESRLEQVQEQRRDKEITDAAKEQLEALGYRE
jgi:arylsulfatase A-like enzyme